MLLLLLQNLHFLVLKIISWLEMHLRIFMMMMVAVIVACLIWRVLQRNNSKTMVIQICQQVVWAD